MQTSPSFGNFAFKLYFNTIYCFSFLIKFIFSAENMELIKKMKKTKITHHFDIYSSGLFFFFSLSVYIYSNWERPVHSVL